MPLLAPSRSMALSPTSFRFAAPMGPHVADGTLRSGHPDWVLLHKSARISGHRNATTAECHTVEGQRIQVSFWLVDPPGVSYFSVYCPGLDRKEFADEPYFHCADAALVFFSVAFVPVPGQTFREPGRRCAQRFIYRAGPGKPSLQLIPEPDIVRPNGVYAILPCGDAGSDHYAAVFLHRRSIAGDKDRYYDLHVFSSVTQAWSSKGTLPGLSENDQKLLADHEVYKVINVGVSSLGFVDLSWGILIVCDILSECPSLKYIPLPSSRVRNMDEDGDPYIAPQCCSDVSSCDSLIKFVEVEFDDRDHRSLGNQDWKATTWKRDVSWNGWRVCSSVNADNISVDPRYWNFLPELWNDKTKEVDLKKLVFYTPTLSKHNDDFLFVMSKLNCEDDKAWVIAVDMRHASVEGIAPYSTKGRSLSVWHCPCTFPKYLELIPGDDVTMHFKRISVADCVLQLLLAHNWFMELDEHLKFGRPTYDECKSLLDCCPVSSLLSDMQEVVKYAFYTGHCEATPKDVDFCLGALENFDVVIRKSVSDPSLSTEAMRSNFGVVLEGLHRILLMVPPAVMVLADACHQNRDEGKFELSEKPGHTKDCKLQGFPDDANLPHCKSNFAWLFSPGKSTLVLEKPYDTIIDPRVYNPFVLEKTCQTEEKAYDTNNDPRVYDRSVLEKTGQTEEKPYDTSNDPRVYKKQRRRRRRANRDGQRAVVGLERWRRLWYLLIFSFLLSATCILAAIIVT